MRFLFVMGEGETSDTAVPRQERIRGHRIFFVPTHSTDTNHKEEGMHPSVQVPEEELERDSAVAAQKDFRVNDNAQKKLEEKMDVSSDRFEREEMASPQRGHKQ